MTPLRSGDSQPVSFLVLRVTLRDINPVIWRRIRVPESYSLHQLHRILQLLFGWLDYHLYAFELGDRRFEAPDPEAEGEDSNRTTLASLHLEANARLEYTYDFGDEWLHEIVVEAVVLQQDSTAATGAGHHSVLHSSGSSKSYSFYHRRPLGETDRNHRVVSID